MSAISVVFPNQLFDPHPAIRPGRDVVLIEDSLFFGDPHHPAAFHKQKLVLHQSSMRHYARRLEQRGHRVTIVAHEPGRTISYVIAKLAQTGVREIELADPEDFLLDRRIRRSAASHGIKLVVHESPLFLTPTGWIDEFFAGESGYLMARFYAAQRKRLGILMNGNRPTGGRWSFDAENRKRLPRGLRPPPVPRVAPDAVTQAAIQCVEREFPSNPGRAEDFWFPVTHEQAAAWLTDFVDSRLASFGDYEDAMSVSHDSLFHSVLTPALNIGLLAPGQVLDAVLAAAESRGLPLNAVEGFVRQVLGWREFVRAVYRREGVRMRTRNFWGHQRPLPRSFYAGTTGLAPVDIVVRRVERLAWCHHIERLMVLSNAMLLCGIRPDDAYRWFMEMFIDAYDWVMVPNVYGMGLFADGGLLATKPYISGSAYLRKMGDVPNGAWCPVWDGLFWSFVAEHRDFFERQPRLSVLTGAWDRLSPDRQVAHRRTAMSFLAGLA